ncbi:hypothetical protein ACLBXM_08765 [Xanthobacteraceae bacterium A53D]
MDGWGRTFTRMPALLLAALALAGCYSTQGALYERGEQVELALSYACQPLDGRGEQRFNVTPRTHGNFSLHHSYEINRKTYKLLKLDAATYLVQEGDERNKQVNYFYMQPHPDGMTLLIPDLAGQGPALEAALRANNLFLGGRTGNNTFLLDGTQDNKLNFLKQISPRLLKPAAHCTAG